jgi:hypothetical protein
MRELSDRDMVLDKTRQTQLVLSRACAVGISLSSSARFQWGLRRSLQPQEGEANWVLDVLWPVCPTLHASWRVRRGAARRGQCSVYRSPCPHGAGAIVLRARKGILMPGEIEKLMAAHAAPEKVADGFGFAQGPVFSRRGYLLFSDSVAGRIMKWQERKVGVFRENSIASIGLTSIIKVASLPASADASRAPKRVARL